MTDVTFRLRDTDGRFLPEPRIPYRPRLRYLPGIDPTPEWWTLAHTPISIHRHDQLELPGLNNENQKRPCTTTQ